MRRKQCFGAKRRLRRRLFHERLENRRLLVATDLASISGLVFDDFMGNGFDAGEEVAGATLTLHRDNGDGVFQQGTDTQVSSTTTASDGIYKFGRLSAGGYFVLQDTQTTVGGDTLQRSVSPLTTITADDAAGMIVTPIDTFDQTTQLVNDLTTGSPVSSSVAAPEVIGGERDIFVSLTSPTGAINLNAHDTAIGLGGLLSFGSQGNGAGERRVSWDGVDGDAANILDTGLGQTDLTNDSDALGLQLQIGADLPGGEVEVRLYSDDGVGGSANRFSTATLAIPQTGGSVSQKEFVPFSSFVPTSGGGADFTQVGAIELEILTGSANVDGQADIVGTVGETDQVQNFDNFEQADLSLTKTIDDETPNLNQQVTFTITLSNLGPDSATNVEVLDQLPTGVNFVSSTPSQGTYNAGTGIWTIGTVNSGAAPTLLLRGTVQSAGERINTAEVSASDQFDPNSTPGNGNASENDQASVSFVTEAIDLSLTKTAVPSTVVVGSNVTFTLSLNNAGPSGATGVVVEDQLPVGISFFSATESQGNYDAGTGLWDVGAVASGGAATLTLIGTVNEPGPKTNTAQVFAANQEDINSTPGNNNPNENDQDSVTIEAPQIDLSLTKGASPLSVIVGQNVTYTINVSNAGPSQATGVTVLDQLPTGVTFVSSAPSQGSYSSATGIWDVGAIPAGGSQFLTIIATVDVAGPKTNTAQVQTAEQPDVDSTPGNGVEAEDDQETVTIEAPQIDLELTKSADKTSVIVGEQVVFTVNLTNLGPSQATGVVVEDFLPAGVSFVDSSATQGTYNSQTGLWTVGTVSGGASPSLTITGRVDAAGDKTNTAQVSAAEQPDIDSIPGNSVESEDDQDSVTIQAPQIDLSLTKGASPATVVVGENVTYTINVSNAGPSQATGVTVLDQLPAGVSFVSSTPSQGSYSSATGIWDIGTIAAGGVQSLTIVATVTVAGPKTNTAQVQTAEQPDPDSTPGNGVEDEDDQETVTIQAPQIDLELTKSADKSSVVVGEQVVFILNLTNLGPSQATGVVVEDFLPVGISFVESNATQGTYSSQTGLWTVGTIAGGASPTLTITGRVDTPGEKTNTAQVNTAEQPDIDSTPGNGVESEDDQDSVTIQAPQIDLSLVKSVDNAVPNVGEDINFTLVLSNVGPDTATNVRVRDLLPAGLDFVSHSTASGVYDPGTGVWNVGTVSNNGSVSLAIVATPTTTMVVTNVTEVIAADQPDADSTPDNNDPNEDDQSSVMIAAQQIDLSLVKTVDDAEPNLNDTISFQIVVDNDGPSNATGVVVQDLLPAGLTFTSSSPSVGSYNPSDGRWTIGDLVSQDTATLVLSARVDNVDFVINTAEVIAADQVDRDSTPGNGIEDEDDQDSAAVVPQQADLGLTKSVNDPTPNVGELATFTITVTNQGPNAATNVRVTDQLPAGITFDSAAPSQGDYNATTGVWTVGTIGFRGQASLDITGLIESSGEKTNTAQVSAVDQFDPNSTPNNGIESEDDQDSVTVVPPIIDLELDKSIDIERPNVGQTVRYTVVVNNQGPDDATNVIVADDLPSGLIFVASDADSGNYDASTGRWNVGNVPANSSATLTIDATVNTIETTTNIADVFAADQFDEDSTPGNSNPNEDDYDSATFMLAQADLSLTKSVDDATPHVGDNVTFTITAANAGVDPATGVTVLDQLPIGLNFVSSSPTIGVYNSSSGIWDIGDLGVDQIATLTLIATSTTDSPVVNVAQVQTADQLDPNSMPGNDVPTENDQDSVQVIGQLIDLSLEKTVSNEKPNVGDTIQFTLTLTNSRSSQATGVSVRDILPTGLTFLNSSATRGSYNDATGVWDIGTVNDGDVVSLNISATVSEILSVVNTAEVITADQPDFDSTPDNGNPQEDDQDSVPVVTQVADLSLGKTVDDERPDVGQLVTFSLNLSNDGPDPATGVRVADTLPEGLRFVSSNPSLGTYNNLTGIWNVGEVGSQSNETLEITAEVLSIGVKTNIAEVSSADQADPDSTPDNNIPAEDDQDSAFVRPTLIDLSLEKTAMPFRPSVGGTLTYTITLRNDGLDTATGIVVEDNLPAGVTLIDSNPSVGVFSNGEWSVSSLDAQGTATLELITRVDMPGEPENRTQVTAADQFDFDSTPGNDDGIDGNGNDEDDQAAITVTTASADLSINKTVSDDRPSAGSEVTYFVELTNGGPDATENVVVLDQIPNGLTFVSSNATVGSYNDANGFWTVPAIGEGNTETLEIVVRVTSLGEKINTAEVVVAGDFDPDSTPANNDPSEDDQDSVSLIPELVDLALTKVVDDPTPNVGDTVRFTLEVTNQGPSTATGVVVSDLLPDGLLATEILPSQGVYDSVNGFWDIGAVEVGTRPRLEIEVLVTESDPKLNIAEIAFVDQPDIDSTPGNGVVDEDDYAQAEITPQIADLELVKTVNNETPNQNEEVFFTVILANRGPNDATNVLVRDFLPDGMIFVRATESSGSYSRVNGLWTIPAVPAMSVASLQLVARVDTKEPVTNRAEVIASDQFDSDSTPDNQVPTEDDIDFASLTPRLVDVSVAASVDKEQPNPGEVVEMTFTVRNDGPDDATGLVIDVDLPEGLLLLSAQPERGTFNSPWSIGFLGVGESVDLVIKALAQTRGTKLVQMQVIAQDQADVDSTPANNIPQEDDQTALLVRVPLFSKRRFLGG